MQFNTWGSKDVMAEVRQLAVDESLDVVLIQEPYVYWEKGLDVVSYGVEFRPTVVMGSGDEPGAGILMYNRAYKTAVLSQFTTPYCVVAEVVTPCSTFYFVSCYFKFCEEIEVHLAHLRGVLTVLDGKRVLLGWTRTLSHCFGLPKRRGSEGRPTLIPKGATRMGLN